MGFVKVHNLQTWSWSSLIEVIDIETKTECWVKYFIVYIGYELLK